MIIERYLFREIIRGFLGIFTVLILVFVSNRFVRYLGDAAEGARATEIIMELVGLKLVSNMVSILPLAFFLAVLVGLGRLYQDSEVTAMTAGGIGVSKLLQAVFWLSLLFGVVVFVLSIYVAPMASAMSDKLQDSQEAKADIIGLIPGKFKELSGGKRVFYAERLSRDKKTMENLFIRSTKEGRQMVLSSEAGYLYVEPKSGDRFMVMVDGYRYEGEPGEGDFSITRFREQAVRIKVSDRVEEDQDVDALPTRQLLSASDPESRAELQWRISMPISIVLLGTMAVLLARSNPRQGKYAKLFNAILVYFFYSNLMSISRELIEDGRLSPLVGIWPVHFVMLLAILLMAFYQSTGRWQLAAYMRERVPKE